MQYMQVAIAAYTIYYSSWERLFVGYFVESFGENVNVVKDKPQFARVMNHPKFFAKKDKFLSPDGS